MADTSNMKHSPAHPAEEADVERWLTVGDPVELELAWGALRVERTAADEIVLGSGEKGDSIHLTLEDARALELALQRARGQVHTATAAPGAIVQLVGLLKAVAMGSYATQDGARWELEHGLIVTHQVSEDGQSHWDLDVR